MGDYWTLDGMLGGRGKHGKDTKQKKLEGKEKKKKKKKDKEGKCHDNFRKSDDSKFIPYSEFLKSEENGLFVVKTMMDDIKLETYIIKSNDFNFPRVALDESSYSYKDWLRYKIDQHDSEVNINKILYASTVKKIDIPKGLLVKIIKNSKDDD